MLAKAGTESANIIAGNIPRSFWASLISKHFDREWADLYVAWPAGRQSKQFLPSVPNDAYRNAINLPRKQLRNIVFFITGHNFLNYHKSLTGKSETSLCRLCQEDRETYHHLFTSCPALLQQQLYHNEVEKSNLNRMRKFLEEPVVKTLTAGGEN